MSTIRRAPISYPVYSSFSYFAPRRGGELPGTWLVAALGVLGHKPGSVRQALYRMELDDELDSRVTGRTKYYRASPSARSELDLAMSKIKGGPRKDWDGIWTLVHFSFRSKQQTQRGRFRNYLKHAGFAELGRSVYIHPGQRSARVREGARSFGVEDHVAIFRGTQEFSPSESTLVKTLWDLGDLNRRYQKFNAKYRRLIRRSIETMSPKEAFVIRFALVFDFLEIAWDDPDLPQELLPRHWPGASAQQLAHALYQTLLPPAIEYAGKLYDEIADLK